MSEPVHPQVGIGNAHLRVADLRRAMDFCRGVLGFEAMHVGVDAAFLRRAATTTTSA